MLFAIKVFDVADSGPLRDIHRKAHLEYLKEFDEQTLFAGPILTDDLEKELGSYRLMEFPDLQSAEIHVEEEPYFKADVQYGAEIRPWSASVPYSWRDCPRTSGYVQYLIHAIDKPDSLELRDELRQEHRDYQSSVSDLYITRGPLLSDDRSHQIGSLMIIDVPNLQRARKFWEDEPFNKGGLFEKVEFYGWRFGRVMDRFKST